MEYETTGRLENMLRQINSESGARQFVNEHTGGNPEFDSKTAKNLLDRLEQPGLKDFVICHFLRVRFLSLLDLMIFFIL